MSDNDDDYEQSEEVEGECKLEKSLPELIHSIKEAGLKPNPKVQDRKQKVNDARGILMQGIIENVSSIKVEDGTCNWPLQYGEVENQENRHN